MGPDEVMVLGQQAMLTTVAVAAPLLLSALAIGLLVGVFQAATQINEMTLSFIPKLMVLVLVLYFAGPWLIRVMSDYMRNLIAQIPAIVS